MSIALVPGKLFLMGEYSVVKGDSPAIILPTNRTLSVSVQASHAWIFESDLEPSFQALDWDDFYPQAFPGLKKILTSFKAHLPLVPLKWTVKSELDDTNHAYGLGSSGAFTIAMIQATYQYFNILLTEKELFKLGVLTQNDVTSSYGDLAVQVYRQPIYYRRPEHLFNGLGEVVIEPVKMPLKYLVIHSGQKVKSAPFVEAFFGKIKTPAVTRYIRLMNETIEDFRKTPTLSLIKQASDAYIEMANVVHPGIVSPVLKDIIAKITLSKGVAKISGAGGGDNVWAFYEDETTYQALIQNLSSYSFL